MAAGGSLPSTRGLQSSTFQLNLSALYGIGGARRGCAARVRGVLGCVSGCVGCLCVSDTAQVELKRNECKPLPSTRCLSRSFSFLARFHPVARFRLLPPFQSSWIQGLTLVHFSAQLKRILWDRGALRGCSGGGQEVFRICQGVLRSIRGCLGCILCQKRLRLR